MDLGHQTNGLFVNSFYSTCTCSYLTRCHIRALFVNRHRLATNSPVHEWDNVVHTVPCFFRQHGELTLASSTGNTGIYVYVPPLASSYPGQAQSCPPSTCSLTCYVKLNACMPVYAVFVCVCLCIWLATLTGVRLQQ